MAMMEEDNGLEQAYSTYFGERKRFADFKEKPFAMDSMSTKSEGNKAKKHSNGGSNSVRPYSNKLKELKPQLFCHAFPAEFDAEDNGRHDIKDIAEQVRKSRRVNLSALDTEEDRGQSLCFTQECNQETPPHNAARGFWPLYAVAPKFSPRPSFSSSPTTSSNGKRRARASQRREARVSQSASKNLPARTQSAGYYLTWLKSLSERLRRGICLKNLNLPLGD